MKKENRTNSLSKTDEEDKIIDYAYNLISGCYFINDVENIDRLHFSGWPSRLQGYNTS